MPKKVMIIGAGAVGTVTVQKCAQFPEVFSEIFIASRNIEKCEAIKARCMQHPSVSTLALDASKKENVLDALNQVQPDLVIHVALPYQNLSIMEACLDYGVHYIDTACYEAEDDKNFSYRFQWPYHDAYVNKKITGILGAGFDPGVTNIFCAYAKKHYLDTIETLDILDCNAGDHGLPFATNFNPEINLRELDAPGRYFEDGQWQTIPSLSIGKDFDFPEAGAKKMYIVYHEELETLTKHFPEIQRARFWMTFSDQYIQHLRAFSHVGLTGIEPVDYQGQKIVPLQFLKTLLPDPMTLGSRTKGKTNIGCILSGVKDGVKKQIYIYQVCDHEETYKETGMQAVAYTAGVPPALAGELVLDGTWQQPGVWNTEQLDPDPYMKRMARYGLPWKIEESTSFDI